MLTKFSAVALLCTTSALGASLVYPRQALVSVELHPNGVAGKCVTVRGNVRQDGTPVEINDCTGSAAQKWDLSPGSTKVQLSGSNFCLDAGSNPANNVGAKIWTCFENLPAQQWFYTYDKRIAVEGKGQCLDLTNGNLADGNQIQTYQCTDNNTNQIWTTATSGGSSSSASSSSAASTTSSASSTTPAPTTPTGTVQLHPNGRVGKCLDVKGNVKENGTPVQIYDCNGSTAQNWLIQRGSTKVQLAGTNFCLDAGSSPANGVALKIWTCFDNLPAQQWFYTQDNRIALEGKGQCTDLSNGSLTNSNPVQTWQCTDNNTNQVWTIASAGSS